MNTKEEMQRRIAHLESRLDHYESELGYLNTLLVNSGFPEGVETLKTTIEQLLSDVSDPFPFLNNNDDQQPPTQTFDPFV